MDDVTYKVSAPPDSFEVPEFGNDEQSSCPLSYQVIYNQTSLDWLTELSSGRGLQYFTDQNENSGTFLITVEATGPEGVTESVSFNFTVEPYCDDQVISAPRVVDQLYYFTDVGGNLKVPEFSNDKYYDCPTAYVMTRDESLTWIT